jgi:hypothetical protein
MRKGAKVIQYGGVTGAKTLAISRVEEPSFSSQDNKDHDHCVLSFVHTNPTRQRKPKSEFAGTTETLASYITLARKYTVEISSM